jgi:glycosyltransferase involved in cell wall biosynthesis
LNVNPLVSVIVPTYNPGEYFVDCIESIYSQSYSNIQLIIIDDCSTDEFRIRLNSIVAGRPCVIIRNEQNLGLNRTCNKAIREAEGKYTVILGHDDVMFSRRIEAQVSFFERYSNASAIFCNSKYLFGVRRSDDLVVSSLIKRKVFNFTPSFAALVMGFQFNSNGNMLRTSLVKEVGGYDEVFKNHGESSLYLKLSLVGNVRYQDEALCWYRVHDQNMTRDQLGSAVSAYVLKKEVFFKFLNENNFRFSWCFKCGFIFFSRLKLFLQLIG